MKTTAYVEVKIKIPCNTVWDEKCTLTEIRKQAKESAILTLNLAAQKVNKMLTLDGEPKVTVVTVED